MGDIAAHRQSQIESLQRLLAEKDAQIAELKKIVADGVDTAVDMGSQALQSANERIEALTREQGKKENK